jgi:hypothetical protein
MDGFRNKLDMDAVRAEWAIERSKILKRGFELVYLENGKMYVESKSGVREIETEEFKK